MREITEQLYPNPPYTSLEIDRGEGIFLYDKNGNRYMNFAESINLLGYSSPELIEAVCSQANKLIHYTNMIARNSPCIELAKRLLEKTGLKEPRIVYTATGSEANETALLYSSKENPVIIGFKHSYHGLLYLTGYLTRGIEKPEHNILIIDDADPQALDRMEKILYFNDTVIIVEAIRVHGGIKPLSEEAVRIINKAVQNGSTLIADEVYTGLGKTGCFYAYQRIGITPNIVTLGKTIGGGLPLGAVLFEKNLLKTMDTGGAITSQGGNVTACKTGYTLLNTIDREKLVEKTRLMEDKIGRLLAEFKNYDFITDVRGYGFIWGIELDKNIAKKMMKTIISKALDKGLIITPMGPMDEVIRLAPPLKASFSDWETAHNILDDVFHEIFPDKSERR